MSTTQQCCVVYNDAVSSISQYLPVERLHSHYNSNDATTTSWSQTATSKLVSQKEFWAWVLCRCTIVPIFLFVLLLLFICLCYQCFARTAFFNSGIMLWQFQAMTVVVSGFLKFIVCTFFHALIHISEHRVTLMSHLKWTSKWLSVWMHLIHTQFMSTTFIGKMPESAGSNTRWFHHKRILHLSLSSFAYSEQVQNRYK